MRPRDGRRERVAIIGLGASGEAAARLALAKGGQVHVTDAKNDGPTAARGAALRAAGADLRLGGHDVVGIAAADTVVVSPGISADAPVLAALRDRGVGWVSEPEFAARFLPGQLTAVTGTNGKTTTAALCVHLLCAGGVNAVLGGNTGAGLAPPASALALLEPAPERVVLELSSFQLADIRSLTPDVGVMTNLGVDHMDRYRSVEEYHRDKRRMFEAGTRETRWVVNADDPAVVAMAAEFPGKRLGFSLRRGIRPGAFLQDDRLWLNEDREAGQSQTEEAVPVARTGDLRLLGEHNIANALAALLAARASGMPRRGAAEALRSFQPLPHRLETVGVADGVRWVNDSKATNAAAAASAIRSVPGRLVVLVGGTDKGESFRKLAAAARGRLRAVVTYGEAGGRAARELEGAHKVVRVDGSFAEAVAAARGLARLGDALLLAPACSSFDMFLNYEERGEAFRALAAEAAS